MPPVNRAYREYGLERVQKSLDRLHRLTQIGAPEPIIANGAASLFHAFEIFIPYEFHAALAEQANRDNRHKAGFCETENCPNLVISSKEGFCAECMAEAEGYLDDLENDEVAAKRDEKLRKEMFACSCGAVSTMEIVHKTDRFWACDACGKKMLADFGPGARFAPLEGGR